MDSKRSKQVYEVLLTPIEFYSENYEEGKSYKDYKEEVKIFKDGSVIKSTQSYYPLYQDRNGKDVRYNFFSDPDMTDFACGFYEIIYNEILKGEKIVKEDGNLFDKNFVGDTMNSFNYIANRVPEAGKTMKNRTPYNTWPEYLQSYYKQYHCLANFWMLPMEIGRENKITLSKGYYDYKLCIGTQDYMDKFLLQVELCWDKYKDYDYFARIKEFDEFARINFLVGSYLYSDMSIFNYSDKRPEEVIYLIQGRMRIRATAISESEEYSKVLYEYFKKYGLV